MTIRNMKQTILYFSLKVKYYANVATLIDKNAEVQLHDEIREGGNLEKT